MWLPREFEMGIYKVQKQRAGMSRYKYETEDERSVTDFCLIKPRSHDSVDAQRENEKKSKRQRRNSTQTDAPERNT